ncbi:hypothetical protein [Pseudoalteromonas sp. H105]|uniref:hypothetical protein n=1 Tax=Pseudoalteromonas sp. H105 TaxID=1348393 RepID=UPI000731F3AC|nr:hypothetical protein [Pseudoalteromonas sp. H105]KTF13251.1 hypothetical protein ATS75_15935 [Pseudoalteromonas sp. H105]
MFKSNYKAWIISIGLHVIVIYFVSRQTIDNKEFEPADVMQAYVMVDLASLPSIQSQTNVTSTTNDPELDTVEEFKKQRRKQETQTTDNVTESAVKLNSTVKSQTRDESKVLNTNEAMVKNQQVDLNHKAVKKPFKKLNPYAPIPQLMPSNKAGISFDYSQATISQSGKEVQRVTVPKEHSSSFESEVLWQNADGSKRLEMYKGMCYKIDFNGVMGKVGLPQGSPRPCKDNDGILFNKIMDKWNKKQ